MNNIIKSTRLPIIILESKKGSKQFDMWYLYIHCITCRNYSCSKSQTLCSLRIAI